MRKMVTAPGVFEPYKPKPRKRIEVRLYATEEAVLLRLAKEMDISPQKVMIQGLRMLQVVHDRHSSLVENNPKMKLSVDNDPNK